MSITYWTDACETACRMMSQWKVPCFTEQAHKAVTKWRNDFGDSELTRIGKKLAAEPVYLGIALIVGPLEAIARSIHTLVIKGISFFAPKSFAENNLVPAQTNLILSVYYTLTSAISLIDNLTEEKMKDPMGSVVRFFEDPSLSCYDGYRKVTKWRDTIHSMSLNRLRAQNMMTTDIKIRKIAKQVATEGAYVGLILFGALEMLARTVYILALKGLSLVFSLDDHLKEAQQNAMFSACALLALVAGLKDNIVEEGEISPDGTLELVKSFYKQHFPCLQEMLNSQIFNFLELGDDSEDIYSS
jgi:hypothetical protein